MTSNYSEIIHIFLWQVFLHTIQWSYHAHSRPWAGIIFIQGFGEEIVVSEGLGDVRAQAHHHMCRFSSSVRNQLQFEQRCWDGGAYYKAKLPSTLTYVRIKKKKFQSKKKLPTVLQINRVYDFVQVYPNYSQEIAWSDLLDKICLHSKYTEATTIMWNLLHCNWL